MAALLLEQRVDAFHWQFVVVRNRGVEGRHSGARGGAGGD
jgi:hypothetical protein